MTNSSLNRHSFGFRPVPMQEDQTGVKSLKNYMCLLLDQTLAHGDLNPRDSSIPMVHEALSIINSTNVSSKENPGKSFWFYEKSKVIEESDSTIPDPSHQTVTSTPPVITPFTDVSSTKSSSLVSPPPINTEATTITTSLPEITPFISLQLRVARLEQEMSEVKKTDHFCHEDAMDWKLHVEVKDHKRMLNSDDEGKTMMMMKVLQMDQTRVRQQEIRRTKSAASGSTSASFER
ncbi:hypothetical protein Tco_0780739 [Tanacetum coccineum]